MKGARRSRKPRAHAGFADLMAPPSPPRRAAGVITGVAASAANTINAVKPPVTPPPQQLDEDWGELLTVQPKRRMSPESRSPLAPHRTSPEAAHPASPLPAAADVQEQPSELASPAGRAARLGALGVAAQKNEDVGDLWPGPDTLDKDNVREVQEDTPQTPAAAVADNVPAFLTGWDGADGWGDEPSFDASASDDDPADAWGAWSQDEIVLATAEVDEKEDAFGGGEEPVVEEDVFVEERRPVQLAEGVREGDDSSQGSMPATGVDGVVREEGDALQGNVESAEDSHAVESPVETEEPPVSSDGVPPEAGDLREVEQSVETEHEPQTPGALVQSDVPVCVTEAADPPTEPEMLALELATEADQPTALADPEGQAASGDAAAAETFPPSSPDEGQGTLASISAVDTAQAQAPTPAPAEEISFVTSLPAPQPTPADHVAEDEAKEDTLDDDHDPWKPTAESPVLTEPAKEPPTEGVQDPFAFEEAPADTDVWGTWSDDGIVAQADQSAPTEEAQDFAGFAPQPDQHTAELTDPAKEQEQEWGARPAETDFSTPEKREAVGSSAADKQTVDATLPSQFKQAEEVQAFEQSIGIDTAETAESAITTVLLSSMESRNAEKPDESTGQAEAALEGNQDEDTSNGWDRWDEDEVSTEPVSGIAETSTISQPEGDTEKIPAVDSAMHSEGLEQHAQVVAEQSGGVEATTKSHSEEAKTPARAEDVFSWQEDTAYPTPNAEASMDAVDAWGAWDIAPTPKDSQGELLQSETRAESITNVPQAANQASHVPQEERTELEERVEQDWDALDSTPETLETDQANADPFAPAPSSPFPNPPGNDVNETQEAPNRVQDAGGEWGDVATVQPASETLPMPATARVETKAVEDPSDVGASEQVKDISDTNEISVPVAQNNDNLRAHNAKFETREMKNGKPAGVEDVTAEDLWSSSAKLDPAAAVEQHAHPYDAFSSFEESAFTVHTDPVSSADAWGAWDEVNVSTQGQDGFTEPARDAMVGFPKTPEGIPREKGKHVPVPVSASNAANIPQALSRSSPLLDGSSENTAPSADLFPPATQGLDQRERIMESPVVERPKTVLPLLGNEDVHEITAAVEFPQPTSKSTKHTALLAADSESQVTTTHRDMSSAQHDGNVTPPEEDRGSQDIRSTDVDVSSTIAGTEVPSVAAPSSIDDSEWDVSAQIPISDPTAQTFVAMNAKQILAAETHGTTSIDKDIPLNAFTPSPPVYPAFGVKNDGINLRQGHEMQQGCQKHHYEQRDPAVELEKSNPIVQESLFNQFPNNDKSTEKHPVEQEGHGNVDTTMNTDHAFDGVRNEFPSSRPVDQILPTDPTFPVTPGQMREGGPEQKTSLSKYGSDAEPLYSGVLQERKTIQYAPTPQSQLQVQSEQPTIDAETFSVNQNAGMHPSSIAQDDTHQPPDAPAAMVAAPFPTGNASNYWTKKLESSSQDPKEAWAVADAFQEKANDKVHPSGFHTNISQTVSDMGGPRDVGMSQIGQVVGDSAQIGTAGQCSGVEGREYDPFAPTVAPLTSNISGQSEGIALLGSQASAAPDLPQDAPRENAAMRMDGILEQGTPGLPGGTKAPENSKIPGKEVARNGAMQDSVTGPTYHSTEDTWRDQYAPRKADATGWNNKEPRPFTHGQAWTENTEDSQRERWPMNSTDPQNLEQTSRNDSVTNQPYATNQTVHQALVDGADQSSTSKVGTMGEEASYDPFAPAEHSSSAPVHDYSELGWDMPQDKYNSTQHTVTYNSAKKPSSLDLHPNEHREQYEHGSDSFAYVQTQEPNQERPPPTTSTHDWGPTDVEKTAHAGSMIEEETRKESFDTAAEGGPLSQANVPIPQKATSQMNFTDSTTASHTPDTTQGHDSDVAVYAPRPSAMLPLTPGEAGGSYAPNASPKMSIGQGTTPATHEKAPELVSEHVSGQQSYAPRQNQQDSSRILEAAICGTQEHSQEQHAALEPNSRSANDSQLQSAETMQTMSTSRIEVQIPPPPTAFSSTMPPIESTHERADPQHTFSVQGGQSSYLDTNQTPHGLPDAHSPTWNNYATNNIYGSAPITTTASMAETYAHMSAASPQKFDGKVEENELLQPPSEGFHATGMKQNDSAFPQHASTMPTHYEGEVPPPVSKLNDRDLYAPVGGQPGYQAIPETNMYTYPFSIMDATASADLDYRPPRPVLSWGFGGSMLAVFPSPGEGQLHGYDRQSESDHSSAVRVYELGRVSGDGSNDDWIAASEALAPPAFPPKESDLLLYAEMCDRLSNCAAGMDAPHAESRASLWRLLALMCRHGSIDWRDKAGTAISGPSSIPMIGRNDSSSFLSGRFAGESPLKPGGLSSRKSELELSESAAEVERLITQGKGLEAVRLAQASGLWSLALILASTFDQTLHKTLITEFAKNSLNDGSALQTLFFSMAENDAEIIRKATTTAGLREWRKTVTMLLTNRRSAMKTDPLRGERFLRLIDQVGDALVSQKGDIVAGHVCYLISGRISALDASSVILLGGDTGRPVGSPRSLGSSSAILQSLVYEAIVHVHSGRSFPHLLPFRLVLAQEIAAVGRSDIALRHCESVAAEVRSLFDTGRTYEASKFLTLPFLAALESLEQRLRTHLGFHRGNERLQKLTALGRSLTAAVFKHPSAIDKPSSVEEAPYAKTPPSANPSPHLPPLQTPQQDLYSEQVPSMHQNIEPLMTDTSHHPDYGIKSLPHGPPLGQPISGQWPAPTVSAPGFTQPRINDKSQGGPGKEESGTRRWNEFVSKTIGVLAPEEGDLSPPPRSRMGQAFPPEVHEVPTLGLGPGTGSRAPGQEVGASHMRSQSTGDISKGVLQMSQAASMSKEREQIEALPRPLGMPTMGLPPLGTFSQARARSIARTPVQEQKKAESKQPLSHRRSTSDMTSISQTSEKKPPRPPRRSTGASSSTSALDSTTDKKPPVSKGWRSRFSEKILSAFRGPPRAHMGKENKFIFDKERGRWIIEGEDPDEGDDLPPPPPDDDTMSETQTTKTSSMMNYDGNPQFAQTFSSIPRSVSMQEGDPNLLLQGQAQTNLGRASSFHPQYSSGAVAQDSMGQHPQTYQMFPPPRAVGSENMAFGENSSETSGISSVSLPTPYSMHQENPSPAVPQNNPNRFRASTGRKSSRRAYVDTFNKGAGSAPTARGPLPGRPLAPPIIGSGASGPSAGVNIFMPRGNAPTPVTDAVHQSPAGREVPLSSSSRHDSFESNLSQQLGKPSPSAESAYQPQQYVPRSDTGPRMMA